MTWYVNRSGAGWAGIVAMACGLMLLLGATWGVFEFVVRALW